MRVMFNEFSNLREFKITARRSSWRASLVLCASQQEMNKREKDASLSQGSFSLKSVVKVHRFLGSPDTFFNKLKKEPHALRSFSESFECLPISLSKGAYVSNFIALFYLPGMLRRIVVHYFKFHLSQIPDDYTSNVCHVPTYFDFEIGHF